MTTRLGNHDDSSSSGMRGGGLGKRSREEQQPPFTVRLVHASHSASRDPATTTAFQAHRRHESEHEDVSPQLNFLRDAEDGRRGGEEGEDSFKEAKEAGVEGQREQYAQAPGYINEGRVEGEDEEGQDEDEVGEGDVYEMEEEEEEPEPEQEQEQEQEEEDEEEKEDEEENGGEEEEECEGEGNDDDEGGNVNGAAASGEADDRRSSQVAGIFWDQCKQKWGARPFVNGERLNLSYHATEEDASQATDKFVMKDNERKASGTGQGLKLVHCSAQLELCMTQENTLHTLNIP